MDAVKNINEYNLFEAFLLDYYGFIQSVCPTDSTDDSVEDVFNQLPNDKRSLGLKLNLVPYG